VGSSDLRGTTQDKPGPEDNYTEISYYLLAGM